MNIVLAIHLHEDPEALLAQAVSWASRAGGRLSLLFVEEMSTAWAVGVSDPTVVNLLEAERESIRATHRDRLDELLATIPQAIRGEADIVSGVPWQAIAEASAEADLLLIGTHGRTGLAHFFLGSVAERVVRAAKCSVLVLRADTSD